MLQRAQIEKANCFLSKQCACQSLTALSLSLSLCRMHLEILKKGFLPAVSFHATGVAGSLRSTFPEETAALTSNNIWEKKSGKKWFQNAKYLEVPSPVPSERILLNG